MALKYLSPYVCYCSSDGPAPYAHVYLPSLVPLQPYDVSLHLVVPSSRANLELGNFMTSLALRGPVNESIADVRKPVRPYAV
jgi:hypothetical protein